MLPDPTLPASLAAVLQNLRWVFTAPSFATFAALATGLIANTGKGTVTGMLTGAGLARTWSHDRAHAFFARAAWSPDTLGMYLARLIVRTLLPDGAALTVAIDDTLFKKSGKKVFGAGWQHDGAARGDKPIGYGVCFVVLGIIVQLPFLTRPVCLPVAVRLWRPKGEATKVEIAAALVKLLAAWVRDRRIDVVADAAYHGPALRHLPGRITVTTRLPASAVLYTLAPAPTGRRGRPRLKGDRLGTPAELAKTATFKAAQVRRYGRTDTVHLAEIECLWYGSFHTQRVRVVLLRDDATETGYDLALVTTDLDTPAAELVTRYAWRWSIEVTFEEAREHLGAGQARNRTRLAVERTTPFALYCYTIVVLWYAAHGHHPADAADRRDRQPWYTSSVEPLAVSC
jgi:DDE superfamily endonuclease